MSEHTHTFGDDGFCECGSHIGDLTWQEFAEILCLREMQLRTYGQHQPECTGVFTLSIYVDGVQQWQTVCSCGFAEVLQELDGE